MIIAIESASTDPSLALADRGGRPIASDAWTSDRRQGAELLPRLIDLLNAAGLDLHEATAVAVGSGPGSFTGLRVGMALAKGLALSLRLPIVGVPSLTAWLASEPDAAAAVARAGAHDAYVLRRASDAVAILDRDRLAAELASERVVAPTELAEAFVLTGARPPRRAAAAVARAAAERLAAGRAGDDLTRLEPVYIRAPRGIGQEIAGGAPWR